MLRQLTAGSDSVGDVLEVRPERGLVAADARAGLPLREVARLLDEVAQPLQRGVREREVASVAEEQLSAAPRERGEQRRERDRPPVDR